jgi:hypothetical protein
MARVVTTVLESDTLALDSMFPSVVSDTRGVELFARRIFLGTLADLNVMVSPLLIAKSGCKRVMVMNCSAKLGEDDDDRRAVGECRCSERWCAECRQCRASTAIARLSTTTAGDAGRIVTRGKTSECGRDGE